MNNPGLYYPQVAYVGGIHSLGAIVINSMNNDLVGSTIGLITVAILVYLMTQFKKMVPIDKFIFWMMIGLFIGTTALFPWFVAKYIPIGFIQLAYRLNTYVQLFAAYLLARTIQQKNAYPVGIIITTLSIVFSTTAYIDMRTNHADIVQHRDSAQLQSLIENYSHRDYSPIKYVNNMEVATSQHLRVAGRTSSVPVSYNESRIKIRVNSVRKASLIEVPIFYYIGQRVNVNGRTVLSKLNKFGMTSFTVPKGRNQIVISYDYSKLERMLTLFAVLTLLISSWYYWRKHRSDTNQIVGEYKVESVN